ncbi:ATP-binding protein [Hespellia stercorisuis]|uniref:GHKL domain-containing protein n=1 Tax=Hespellia stercorisuis DSM 15480 TaxID=1121950 RepID=A0A1M6RBH7_9FIRM|nr:ATP-binding protein [Hespellia stercorisuis]SHK29792.1 GHKL domain-containing protein [Hespellia stercorisuis DSM 15480]
MSEVVTSCIRLGAMAWLLSFWSMKGEDKRWRVSTVITLLTLADILLISGVLKGIHPENLSPGLVVVDFSRLLIEILYMGFVLQDGLYYFVKWHIYHTIAGYTIQLLTVLQALVFKNLDMILYSQVKTGDTLWPLALTAIGIGVAAAAMKKKVFERITYRWAGLIVMTTVLIEFTIGMATLSKGYSVTRIFATFMSLSVAFTFFAVILGNRYYQSRVLSRKYKEILDSQYAYYDRIRRCQIDMRRLRHDLGNHMQVTEQLAEEKADYQHQLLQFYDTYLAKPVEVQAKKKKYPVMAMVLGGLMILEIALALLPVHFVLKFPSEIYWIFVYYWALMLMTLGVLMVYNKSRQDMDNREMSQIIEQGNRVREEWSELMDSVDSGKLTESAARRYASDKAGDVERIHTGNSVMDVMLQEMQQTCAERGIETELRIEAPPSEANRMNPVDMVGLFGNLLDNGLEACMRKTDGARFLHIHTKLKANFWCIVVENSKPEDAQPVEEKFQSRKGAEHGQGHRIIEDIVKKYDGVIQYRDAVDTFVVTAMVRVQ